MRAKETFKKVDDPLVPPERVFHALHLVDGLTVTGADVKLHVVDLVRLRVDLVHRSKPLLLKYSVTSSLSLSRVVLLRAAREEKRWVEECVRRVFCAYSSNKKRARAETAHEAVFRDEMAKKVRVRLLFFE